MVFVSMASLWELQIKTTIGKLRLPDRFFEELEPAGFQLLPIALQDVERYGALPLHHRDPFDRMLIAQAQHHALTLVTRDDALARYDVDRLLA
jgi:PIN domain nuclease of toxin-antitoxin system